VASADFAPNETDAVIYDHVTNKGFNAELRFLDLSDPASDVDPDPENWEDISRVGALLGLAGTDRLVTQVDVQMDNYLERAYTGTMFLQFHQNDAVGGGPGTPIGAEITAPISVNTVGNGPFVNVIDFSFTDLSTDLSGFNTVWYSLGIRDVLYTGGTGGFYLAQISDLNGPEVGSLGFGFWELDPPSGTAPGWHPSDMYNGDWSTQAPNIRIFAASSGTSGDFDHDEDVDGADFLVWQRGESPVPGSDSDFALWKAHFGTSAATASLAGVPEPETVTLVVLCTLAARVGRIRWAGKTRAPH
jgi:hypothetical protein